jgi:tellurite resistance-related uncharacterized protein
MMGKMLNCVRCDKFEMPDGFIPYKRTPVFTEIPAALRKDHSTKAGVWAKITVLEGKLRYRVAALDADTEVSADNFGIVVPEVPHHVEPLGTARFFVEFYRAPDQNV